MGCKGSEESDNRIELFVTQQVGVLKEIIESLREEAGDLKRRTTQNKAKNTTVQSPTVSTQTWTNSAYEVEQLTGEKTKISNKDQKNA